MILLRQAPCASETHTVKRATTPRHTTLHAVVCRRDWPSFRLTKRRRVWWRPRLGFSTRC